MHALRIRSFLPAFNKPFAAHAKHWVQMTGAASEQHTHHHAAPQQQLKSHQHPHQHHHTGDVIIKQGPEGILHITMNRPKALNAGHLGMVEAIAKALSPLFPSTTEQQGPSSSAGASASSSTALHPAPGPCHAVVVEGCVPRAFCSGGDIKALRQSVLDAPYAASHGECGVLPPDGHLVERVFRAEYSLVSQVPHCKVPYVSLIRGVWMGLGFGLAGFGTARVVSDNVLFAMPENAIGLWPDVGWVIRAARMPGALGLWLGLTGARVSQPADLLYLGLATHYVPEAAWEGLRSELLAGPGVSSATGADDHAWVASVLARHATAPPQPSRIAALRPIIDRCFGPALEYVSQGLSLSESLQAVMHRLEAEMTRLDSVAQPSSSNSSNQTQGDGSDGTAAAWARTVISDGLDAMRAQCPFSQALTLAHFVRVREDLEKGGPLVDLGSNMQLEYGLAVRMVARPDFAEGVRAVLVDKCKAPTWTPATLDGISDAAVEAVMTSVVPAYGLFYKRASV